VIEGDLISYGQVEPELEDGVQILGQKRHEQTPAKAAKTERSLIFSWILSVIVWFATVQLLIYMLPGLAASTVKAGLDKSGKSLGIGFLWVLLMIPLAVVLVISVVLWPLAVAVVLLSGLCFLAAYAYSMVMVGVWLMNKLKKQELGITWRQVLIGVVVMRVITLIPVLGGLLMIVVLLIALGALAQVLWSRLKKEEATESVTA